MGNPEPNPCNTAKPVPSVCISNIVPFQRLLPFDVMPYRVEPEWIREPYGASPS